MCPDFGCKEPIRFMDCNCRIGTFESMEPVHFTDVSGLLAEMEYIGISEALVMHQWSAHWAPQKGNEKVDELIAPYDNLFPCYTAVPSTTDEMEAPVVLADRAKANRGAVRLFPVDNFWTFEPWACDELMRALEARAVPVLIDMGQTNWSQIATMLQTYDQLPMIVLDTSYRVNRNMYPLLDKYPNLHIETHTYQIPWGIEDVCRRFGTERLIFGTGLPQSETGGAIAQVVYSDLGEDAKRQIAGGTLRRLLGISSC